MATSGTVGQTVISTAKVIEHAVRRCGLLASQQTPEVVYVAKDCLFLLLMHYANTSLNLWCVERKLVGLQEGRRALSGEEDPAAALPKEAQEGWPGSALMTDIIPFAKPPKDVANMTADEILAHLKGRFKTGLAVVAFNDDGLVEVNSNMTHERAYWALNVASRLMIE